MPDGSCGQSTGAACATNGGVYRGNNTSCGAIVCPGGYGIQCGTAGTFTFTARADDGVRVFVDGVAVIDQFHDQPATTYTANRTLKSLATRAPVTVMRPSVSISWKKRPNR